VRRPGPGRVGTLAGKDTRDRAGERVRVVGRHQDAAAVSQGADRLDASLAHLVDCGVVVHSDRSYR